MVLDKGHGVPKIPVRFVNFKQSNVTNEYTVLLPEVPLLLKSLQGGMFEIFVSEGSVHENATGSEETTTVL